MNSQQTIVEVRSVHKIYQIDRREVAALRGVNLKIFKGEVLAIIGPSGCGKSTLLHLIGGLDQPSSGEITFAGTNLSSLSDDELTLFRRKNVGFIFQQFHLISSLTARENIALPFFIAGTSIREKADKIEELGHLLGLGDRLDHFPDQLSGGEQQRVAIARALVIEPSLVLADEPTGNLDSETGEQVIELLIDTTRKIGSSMVLVTHNNDLLRFADRQLNLKDGVFYPTQSS